MAKAIFDVQQTNLAQLDELLSPQAGAVISKPLVQTDACKVVLFAMDAEQAISDHKAPYVAIVHVLDGELAFDVQGEAHELRAGSYLTMPPNAVHNLTARTPVRFLLTLIKP